MKNKNGYARIRRQWTAPFNDFYEFAIWNVVNQKGQNQIEIGLDGLNGTKGKTFYVDDSYLVKLIRALQETLRARSLEATQLPNQEEAKREIA